MKKNIVFYCLFCLFLGSACQEDQAKSILLSGKAVPGVEKMILVQNQGMFRTVAESPVDSAGNYTICYDAERPGLFLLGDAKYRKSVSVFGRPGDRIQVDFSGGKVCFGEDEKRNNEFLERLTEQLIDFQRNNRIEDWTDADQNRNFYLKRRTAMCRLIKAENLKDKEFEGTLLADEEIRFYNALLKYPSICKSATGQAPVLPEDYYAFVKEVDLSSPYLINIGDILPFLQELFSTMETKGYLKVGAEDYLKKRGERIADQTLKEEYYLYALGLEQHFWHQHLGKVIASVEPEIISEKNKMQLAEIKQKQQELTEKYAAFQPGQPAFNFKVTDRYGKPCEFKDFKGKIVLVDVWNTGCVPCIAEIPYLKKLEERFKSRDIVFLSYSLDTNREKWLKFIAAHEMEGHLLIDTLGFRSEFARYYRINSIPRFLIFDREGNIADAFAPRPSDPKLTLQLENLLNALK